MCEKCQQLEERPIDESMEAMLMKMAPHIATEMGEKAAERLKGLVSQRCYQVILGAVGLALAHGESERMKPGDQAVAERLARHLADLAKKHRERERERVDFFQMLEGLANAGRAAGKGEAVPPGSPSEPPRS